MGRDFEMTYSREQLEAALFDAAARYAIDPDIAWRQINQESGFNPNAVSPAGAKGIAQFMPDTAARFGLANPFDPIASFDAWGRYMRLMLDMFGGRYDLALAGYNSGENRNEYKAAAREGRPINWSVLPSRVQSETRNYVISILGSDSPVVESGPTVEPTLNIFAPTDQTEAGAPGDGGELPLLALALGGLVLIILITR
jgi:soluble lytic murein transglycosylase-like protein